MNKEETIVAEQVNFVTKDDVTIVGDLYRPAGEVKGGVILLHMMPATRSSWLALATMLSEHGLLALAIDLRGHGESTKQGKDRLTYQKFSDAQHIESDLDIEAALGFLTSHEELPINQIGLMGASIGANLALTALSRHTDVPWAVLLSPGLNYHGVTTEKPMKNLATGQRLLIVASGGDSSSLASVRELLRVRPDNTQTIELSGAGHGTTMFENTPTLMNDILQWITDSS